MIKVDCLLCGSSDSQVLIEENGYQGRKCSGCGLIYVSPRPSLEEIHDLYGHDEAKVAAESHITSAFPKRLYAKHHLKIIQRYVRGGKLLEIGAGAGYFLDEARKCGFDCNGIEFNPIQAEYIRDHFSIDCEQTALGQSSYMAERFDLVYHCDVISHFYNPIEELGLMKRVLNNGGYMVFETGNIGDMDQKYFQYIEKFQYPDHLFFFGVTNIEQLLAETGFELVRLYRYSLIPQLRLTRAISKLKGHISGKSTHSAGAREDGNRTVSVAKTKEKLPYGNFAGALKMLRINTMEYLYFLLRYRFSRIWTLPEHPQTFIVVARKISDTPD